MTRSEPIFDILTRIKTIHEPNVTSYPDPPPSDSSDSSSSDSEKKRKKRKDKKKRRKHRKDHSSDPQTTVIIYASDAGARNIGRRTQFVHVQL